MNSKHCAIYVPGNLNKDKVVQDIYTNRMSIPGYVLHHLKVALYSATALYNFIAEELIHEHFDVATENKISLTTSSGGQQKKALLNHLLTQKWDCIIIDDVFDHLDTAAQQQIIITLHELSGNTGIIQILNRKKDILPFIKDIYTVQNNSMIAGLHENEIQPADSFKGIIPPPLQRCPIQQNPLVQFTDVSVSYNDVPVVKNICWQINKGEFWQLIGPNGSGKSTLLSMIYGDNTKGYGQNIILFGQRKGSGESVWDIKEKVGYFSSSLTQQFQRMDSLEQMIVSGFNDSIGLYLKPTDVQLKLAAQWLQLLHIYNVKQHPFINFSLAQQRLVLIARAMVKHPRLLILDEPTAGLDDASIALFTSLANKIAAESNTAIIYVSHRAEKSLLPHAIFELIPGTDGSVGKAKKNNNTGGPFL
jgi:molybdate transport system ATP-binding protein